MTYPIFCKRPVTYPKPSIAPRCGILSASFTSGPSVPISPLAFSLTLLQNQSEGMCHRKACVGYWSLDGRIFLPGSHPLSAS